ncbi:MAG: DHH family phosphoesterase [Clostridiales bacterium]|nr:DHH family phosphoesterase [Clostridiales bacterium]
MKRRKDIYRLFRPSMRMYFAFLVVFAFVALFTKQYALAIGETAAVALLALYSWISERRRKNQVINYIEAAAYNLDGASKGMLMDMPFPMVIFNINNGHVLWSNEGFLNITGSREHFFEISIEEMVPGFKYRWLLDGKHSSPDYIRIGERTYNVCGSAVKMDEKDGSSVYWGILYWLDVTEQMELERKYKDSRLVVAVMMLDNYDELFKNVTETAKSAVLAAVDSVVMAWGSEAKGYLSRYDRDRYIFIFEEAFMPKILADKFAVLDRVREINGPGGIPATMSIGIGRGAPNLEEGFQNALLGIDMALSRGGDQAVIKNNNNFEFYGGHSLAVEKRTKVKSRVMATALGELIADASNIIITGHKRADLDCVGAAVGICCIARKKGKAAYMVIDKDTNVSKQILKKLMKLPEYEHTFISEDDAMLIADGKTLLVVVDTNRPDQVEAGDLLVSCNRIAVVDHHRRAAEYISNAALNFHEPYASSASELATELLQYLIEPADLLKVEAEAILAGIVLDTKNFTMRTGSRTFEAAAFLRKAGSDTTEVKRLFQSDLSSAVAKYSIIRNAKIYRDGIAIAVMETQEDRIIAAQAADELLNISGINTSFVIYNESGNVNISARSISDVNVQFVLEKLGGGGNRSMAGAQIKNKTTQEVLAELLSAIESFFAEEEARKESE